MVSPPEARCGRVRALTLVNDHLLQLPLGRSSLQDLLVDGVGSDQAVDHHRFGLTNAVAAVLGLQVGLRVLGGSEFQTQDFIFQFAWM